MFQTHPLDLHEIRSRVASSLSLNDLASCASVSQDWNDSFTPPLNNSVILLEDGPSLKAVERNKHLIRRLVIRSSAYLRLSRHEVVSTVLAISTLTTLNLSFNNIGSHAEALSEALKTNSTLATLELRGNKIEDDGAKALSEPLKTNSTLATLDLGYNSIRENGAQALSETLKTNSTLATLDLNSNLIGSDGAQALSEALKTNSTLATLDVGYNKIGDDGA
jgi:Ran GTPase-activating protein (RanGAP) involved in mRNA processing and transport